MKRQPGAVVVSPRADELYIVMELLDSDLHRIIQSKQALSEAHHRFFMLQLLRVRMMMMMTMMMMIDGDRMVPST
jgi:hypothetical protein